MRTVVYKIGRFLQLVALLVLPSSIWVGHFGHNERGAILIFLGTVALFFIGWLLTRLVSPK